MIQMKAGTFGLSVNGYLKAMTKESGPFVASEEQEARLVKMGLAVYVGETITVPDDEDAHTIPDGVTGIPEYSTENTVAELREIGKLCGLTFKVGMSKVEMVAALDAHIEANTVEGVEVDEDGEVVVSDDEDAPSFDASQAVQ